MAEQQGTVHPSVVCQPQQFGIISIITIFITIIIIIKPRDGEDGWSTDPL